jgi:hypothetical protein
MGTRDSRVGRRTPGVGCSRNTVCPFRSDISIEKTKVAYITSRGRESGRSQRGVTVLSR